MLRKDGKKKKNYCQCVLVVLGISREKITTSGAASPLWSVGGSVLPGFYLSFISAGSPSTHCYHSCSCSPTSSRHGMCFPGLFFQLQIKHSKFAHPVSLKQGRAGDDSVTGAGCGWSSGLAPMSGAWAAPEHQFSWKEPCAVPWARVGQ